jgi:hypothetical protein
MEEGERAVKERNEKGSKGQDRRLLRTNDNGRHETFMISSPHTAFLRPSAPHTNVRSGKEERAGCVCVC